MPISSQPGSREHHVTAVGSHIIHQEKLTTALEEYQWNINVSNGITFTGNQLIRAEYRHTPRFETCENLFVDYVIRNDGATDVRVLPLWTQIREFRVYINNKRVVDLNREEELRSRWNDTLLTAYEDDQTRQNYNHVATGEGTVLEPATNRFQPVTLAAGGGQRQFHLKLADVWAGFKALALNKIGLLEIEFVVSNRQDFVSDLGLADLVINDLTMYSKHKQWYGGVPPSLSANHTFLQHEYDTLILTPNQHNFSTTPNSELRVTVSTDFPKRRYIQRLLVYSRVPGDPEAFRLIQSDWVSSMELRRGGRQIHATENHYDTRRKIYKEVLDYYHKHYHMSLRTVTGELGHGESFFTNFIDCTTLQNTLNEAAGNRHINKQLNGIDNFSNLELVIRNDATLAPADSDVVILLEYYRFDRLFGNGAVARILENRP
jgi:hypothetical protein